MNRQKIEEAIWNGLDTSGGPNACWEWKGPRNSKGYGIACAGGRAVAAHRLVYETLVGGIPEGMMVCHICDNPPCCNPAHLFAGTARDNTLDMMRKGRDVRPKSYEVRDPQKVFLNGEINAIGKAIFDQGMSVDEAAEWFGIKRSYVRWAQTQLAMKRMRDEEAPVVCSGAPLLDLDV